MKKISKITFSTPKSKNTKCGTRYAGYELAKLANMSRVWTQSIVDGRSTLGAPSKKIKLFFLKISFNKEILNKSLVNTSGKNEFFDFFRGRTKGATTVYY